MSSIPEQVLKESTATKRPLSKRLGLIVNPIAGLGGRVGLKGSDDPQIQQKARALGGKSEAQPRTLKALEALASFRNEIELLTPPGEMGEAVARQAGFDPIVISTIVSNPTTREDTIQAAQAMQRAGVDLLLFAGGDGTARDLYRAVGNKLPVLGIPAGVKIYSAVFAINPLSAGRLAAEFLSGKTIHLQEAEVIDLDEQAYRQGEVFTRLYGYLTIPYRRLLVQNQKVPTPASQAALADAIAAQVIEEMQPGRLYLLGPGTTTRAVALRLGLPKTLVGVDVLTKEQVICLDAGEAQLLELVQAQPATIIITLTGGQGFLFGRGNQQISPSVLRKVGRQNLVVICPPEKLHALQGRPLLVDTGDHQVDRWLSGYLPIITGYRQRAIYRVESQIEDELEEKFK